MSPTMKFGQMAPFFLIIYLGFSGFAQAQSHLVIDPPAIDFGTIETKATATELLVLSNTGDANLEITDFQKSGSANFFIDAASPAEPCGSETPNLSPGQTCQIAVNFSPSGTEPFSATLTFTSNDPVQPTIIINLNGNGLGGDCSLGTPSRSNLFIVSLLLLPAFYLIFRRKNSRH